MLSFNCWRTSTVWLAPSTYKHFIFSMHTGVMYSIFGINETKLKYAIKKIILKFSIHAEKNTTLPLKTQKIGFIKYFVQQLNNRVQFLSTFIKSLDWVLKRDDYWPPLITIKLVMVAAVVFLMKILCANVPFPTWKRQANFYISKLDWYKKICWGCSAQNIGKFYPNFATNSSDFKLFKVLSQILSCYSLF